MNKFTWPGYPATPGEFDALMQAADAELHARGVKIPRRPLHVSSLFWEALSWCGNLLPAEELANASGYSGDVLMAKALHWYTEVYGDKLKSDFAIGYAPYKLGNAVWRVRVPIIYGEITIFAERNLQDRGPVVSGGVGTSALNVLRVVEGLPQGVANKLSDTMLKEYFEFFVWITENLQWRCELPDNDWFRTARHDYDQCTEEVLAGRFGQARWAAQQSLEKMLKGLLFLGGTSFPTSGGKGHDLMHLGTLLETHHGIHLSATILKLAGCSANVRYGTEASSEEQALAANHAVLKVMEQLRNHPKTSEIFAFSKSLKG